MIELFCSHICPDLSRLSMATNQPEKCFLRTRFPEDSSAPQPEDPLQPPVQEEGTDHSDCESDSNLDSTDTETESKYQPAHSSRGQGVYYRVLNSVKSYIPFLKKANNPSHLGCYGVKGNNNPMYGNSVCFVIVNFTDDLKGYQKDAKSIVKFHKEYLKCDQVFEGEFEKLSMRDLTKEKFIEVLVKIQKYLNDEEKGKKIDRFFLYILSHGDEFGIKMCESGSGIEVQEINGQPVRVSMEEIVAMFTHDKVPTLKGFPKVFINQSCQGKEVLRFAGGQGSGEPPRYKLAIGADVIICYATIPKHLSLVSKSGSVFIKTLLNMMRKYVHDETFYDILVEVNNLISKDVFEASDPKHKEPVEAAQLPMIRSQLTRKFYLACPN